MDQPTRKLLAVLGSDICGSICERLESTPATKTELVEELGLQNREVAATLDALLLVGLARYRAIKDGTPGRPAMVWELTGRDELNSLERYVKEMRYRLIDSDPSRGGLD
jgi:predicted ArsR family transcriptional regulator